MGIFGDKKKKTDNERKKRVLKAMARRYRKVRLPVTMQPEITSREYRIFKKGQRRKLNWYETLTSISEKFMKISPDKSSKEEIQKAIGFTGLQITPEGVMSLFAMTVILFAMLGIAFIVAGLLPVMGGVLLIALGLLIGYYFLKYPQGKLKSVRIEASSQIVLAILYMVVSMRISPNLERALKFAASNISGALAWDMRRLIWDIEMGKYYSASYALDYYIEKWKPENEEFSESLRLIRDSMKQTPQRSMAELDEALNVVLDGTRTRMKHYAQNLQLPVMIIHMMGIVLPILGTIMAPLAAVFMSELVGIEHFIIGYNIVLPIVIIWFINNTLGKRPVTYSRVDISKHPDLPSKGHFRIGKKTVPVLPFALIATIVIAALPLMFFIENPDFILSGIKGREPTLFSLTMSVLITVGIAVGLVIYFLLSNFQRIKIQNEIQSIEREFELALFQLGNKIGAGTPTEVAIEKSIGDMKDLKIAGLFRLCLRNIRNLGMTFEQSLFHPAYGALKYYPSELIKNIMYAVVDTAKKGVRYASESMMRIAKYLKNIKETQEHIRNMLSETVSSMKFQAYLLTPLITGLIVSMADIIVRVLAKLGEFLQNAGIGEIMGFGDISGIFGNMESSVSPEAFQLVVGIYLIEVIIILGMFITKIEQGENKIAQWYSTGKMLILALAVYALVALTSSSIFGNLIEDALTQLGVLGA